MSTKYQTLTDAEGGVWDMEARERVTRFGTPGKWAIYQEWLTAGGVPLPPDPTGQLDLADAKAQRVAEINSYAAGLRNKVIAGRSAGEMASWTIKLMEARQFQQSGLDTDAPTLAATAAIRGISTAALVEKVLAQAAPFLQAEAAIDGIRGKHCDAIEACATQAEIVVYDWHAGWPVI